MNAIRIAVVSDVHVGGARCADLCPVPPPGATTERYIDRFCDFAIANALSADLLACPGDATHTLQANEVALATAALTRISAAVGVSLDRVFAVPGNHDVNWAVLTGTGNEHDPAWDTRFIPLRGGGHLLSTACSQGGGNLFDAPFYSITSTPQALVLQINTAAFDGKNPPHHGRVAQTTVDAIATELALLPVDENQLRLAIVHHHPIQYSNPLPDDPDFSIMVNAGNLLTVLQHNYFDLMIHGHRHAPKITAHSLDGLHPLVILGAGSFSARLDTRWAGIVNNQFHIVDIEGRSNNGCVFGSLRSWAFVAHPGWIRSAVHNGIEHRRYFGLHLVPAELDVRLRAAIAPLRGPGARVLAEQILTADPQLLRASLPAFTAALDRFRVAEGIEIYGTPPDDFVMIFP